MRCGGFSFELGGPLNGGSASSSANDQLDTVTTSRIKKKVQRILHPIADFTVHDNPSIKSANLTLNGKQAFATGGRITILSGPSGGVASDQGSALGGNTTFTISKGGRTIGPA